MSLESLGAFHSTQNSGHFGWYIKWNGPFGFGPTGIFGISFEGSPLRPIWSFWLVGPKCPFPFAKIVVPSTALLYPAYKNNNQTRGGLGRVCATGMYRSIGHVEFPSFQMGILLNGKHPIFRISGFGRYSDKPLRLTLITNINIYLQLLLSVLTPNNYA